MLNWFYIFTEHSPQEDLAWEGYVHDLSLRPLARTVLNDKANESSHKHTNNGGHGEDILPHERLELALILLGSRHGGSPWICLGPGQPWVLSETLLVQSVLLRKAILFQEFLKLHKSPFSQEKVS